MLSSLKIRQGIAHETDSLERAGAARAQDIAQQSTFDVAVLVSTLCRRSSSFLVMAFHGLQILRRWASGKSSSFHS